MEELNKEYERTLNSKQLARLPFAGESRKAQRGKRIFGSPAPSTNKFDSQSEEKLWYKMDDQQNDAAYNMDFMRSKKQTTSMVAAGVSSGMPNMQLNNSSVGRSYKYQPPFGYGGNLSTEISHEKIKRGNDSQTIQDSYNDFMMQLSHPVSKSRVGKRAPYFGNPQGKQIEIRIKNDPNLNIRSVGRMPADKGYLNQKSRELGTSKPYVKPQNEALYNQEVHPYQER